MRTKIFVEPFSHLHVMHEKGWGNGYVCLPPGHVYHSEPYEDIPVDVHGGLTYGQIGSDCGLSCLPDGMEDWWIVGFDTAHWRDSPELWPKWRVEQEAEELQKQLDKEELFIDIFSL